MTRCSDEKADALTQHGKTKQGAGDVITDNDGAGNRGIMNNEGYDAQIQQSGNPLFAWATFLPPFASLVVFAG